MNTSKRRAKHLVESLISKSRINESTDYYPENPESVQTFDDMKTATQDDGFILMSAPKNDDADPTQVSPTAQFDSNMNYCVHDGVSYLWVEFDQNTRRVTSLSRYGGNDPEALLAALGGDFVDEHSMDWGDDEDETE